VKALVRVLVRVGLVALATILLMAFLATAEKAKAKKAKENLATALGQMLDTDLDPMLATDPAKGLKLRAKAKILVLAKKLRAKILDTILAKKPKILVLALAILVLDLALAKVLVLDLAKKPKPMVRRPKPRAKKTPAEPRLVTESKNDGLPEESEDKSAVQEERLGNVLGATKRFSRDDFRDVLWYS